MALRKITVVVFYISMIASTFSWKQLKFEKCNHKGFTCEHSEEFPTKKDLIFSCNNITGQDIIFRVWSFNSPKNLGTLTVQMCENVNITFECYKEGRSMSALKIKDVENLQITQSHLSVSPQHVVFERIGTIETIPMCTFTQTTSAILKSNCYIPTADLHSVQFNNVKIGTVETAAFKNLTNIKQFSWQNVTVERFSPGAVNVDVTNDGYVLLKRPTIKIMEPLSLQIIGDSLTIIDGRIENMWPTSIMATLYDFQFTNNSISKLQSAALAIKARKVYITDNLFRSLQSGSFQMISPGVVPHSPRNEGNTKFIFVFENNLVEHVMDGGVRPNIESYKNVQAEVLYKHNTLECSCDTLSWFGTDIDLGYGFSVLKDFNAMLMEPKNKNTCSFNPCMCFGVSNNNS